MNTKRPSASTATDRAFDKSLSTKLARKLRVQRGAKPGAWFGLGMFGLIGWSVAIPTLLGALSGLWWDKHHPSAHSWTLALLVAGLVMGCVNAWGWIVQESHAMQDNPADDHE